MVSLAQQIGVNPQFDVAIIGGGLAGNLLARHLRRHCPKLSLALFERCEQNRYKVGESTVELASHYMVRRLGLSRYLYQHQLPKNGLRFFFDNNTCSASLFDMSEMGTYGLPLIPSFQLDRGRMERYLLENNRHAGVTLVRGARVRQVSLSEDAAPHRFMLQRGDDQLRVKARWLVDASGRAGVLAKQLRWREPESHAVSAVWGRFSGVKDMDDMGPPSFRQRVRYTSRGLSTNHFCYPGYWIWLIPLGQGVTSVGVVMARGRARAWHRDGGWRSEAGFWQFLRRHRAVASLLEGAKMLDVRSYGQAAYGCKQYFHTRRFALIGEAASFTDPLYSPGSDFIALSNDLLVDLIARDEAADFQPNATLYGERVALYNRFMRYRFLGNMRLYRGLYGLLGSYELFRLKWSFDIACYYNLWLEPYLADQHLDARYLTRLLSQQSLEMAALDSFAALFTQLQQHLERGGRYYRGNLGQYLGDFEAIAASATLGSPASRRGALRRTHGSFNRVRNQALDLLADAAQPVARTPLPMRDFLRGRSLLP